MRTVIRNTILIAAAGTVLAILGLRSPAAEGELTAAPLEIRRLTRRSPLTPALAGDESRLAPLTLTEFFTYLYEVSEKPYTRLRNPDIRNIVRRFGLSTDGETRQRIAFLFFLHDLFTGSGVRNGATGGLLGIPYYKHWTIPNPRHALVLNSDGTPLTGLKPPGTHSRYDTLADLDRTPDIFLGDLARGAALYRAPDGKTFSTFGWCSEREMAFTALLTLYGYEAKIVQRGSHTHTEVRLVLKGRQGEEVPLILIVDNTWDKVRFTRDTEPELPFDTWKEQDIGAGTFILWYNERARDPLLLATLEQIAVMPEAEAALIRTLESRL